MAGPDEAVAKPLALPAPRARSAWDAWGNEAARLPAGAKALVATVLPGRPTPCRADPRRGLTPSRITESDTARLAAIVGEDAITRDDAVRALHLGGKSTPDLLARRLTEPQRAPDAVVSPASHEQIAAVLAACDERLIAVVPFGGGTSVVGGVDPDSGAHTRVVALDLTRTAALWHVDETSLLATLGAGTTGPQAEELLNARGYTLGHFPQSFEYASIGGYAATRSSGQASRGYGRFDDLVHALRDRHPRVASCGSDARPPAPPARTCGSCSSVPRARSASSPRSPCASARCREPPPTAPGPSPTSAPEPRRCASSRSAASVRRCCG